MTHYSVYLAEDQSGASPTHVGNAAVGTNSFGVPISTSLASYTHILVYAESTTPGYQMECATTSALVGDEGGEVIADSSISASSAKAACGTQDSRLSSTAGWCPTTAATSEYIEYALGASKYVISISTKGRADDDEWVATYTLSYSTDGSSWTTYGTTLTGNSDRNTVQTNTLSPPFKAAFVRLSPATWSTHPSLRAEITGCDPSSGVAIVDSSASASSAAFSDLDLDAGDLGGTSTWSAPGDTSLVANYVVYLAEDATGTNKAELGTVAVGTNALDMALDTAKSSYTHVLVFTKSSLGEQTTPASVTIVDASA
jgi:hypothetical protein